MQHAVSRQAALGTLGPMADSPEGRFNRITGPKARLAPLLTTWGYLRKTGKRVLVRPILELTDKEVILQG